MSTKKIDNCGYLFSKKWFVNIHVKEMEIHRKEAAMREEARYTNGLLLF
tara:strand:+ start:1218 stop:1364 length:147 start_codon:yes stop_codon:yes gene_type:complete